MDKIFNKRVFSVVIFIAFIWFLGTTLAADLYEKALNEYRSGNFSAAIETLNKKTPKDAGDYNLLGWAFLRAGNISEATKQFESSLLLDPSALNSFCGLGYSYYQKGLLDKALENFNKGTPHDSKDIDCLIGKGLVLEGLQDVVNAIEVFKKVLTVDKNNQLAKEKLRALLLSDLYSTGIDKIGNYKAKPPELAKSNSIKFNSRTNRDYFEVLDKNKWKKIYIKGVNIGPARPGEFPSTPPQDIKTYLGWLKLISDMNANTVRVYTILPPAFYQALKIHNDNSPKKLLLLQEVWLTEREDEKNLYSESWTDEFKNEIKDVIDLLHGNAKIPYRRGHASGSYTVDISQYVFAIGLGRELEPSVAIFTNKANPYKKSYNGEYIVVKKGNPSEVWFAEMLDFAVKYEMQKYNSQRPLTIINWPPLDPMYHITEANYEEELVIRRKRGEDVQEVTSSSVNDSDAVSLDINNLKTTEKFRAGLFAAYHVYSHWPDFLFTDPEYPKIHDYKGSNRYFGYLLDLKKNHPDIPLLIAEYGISTSWGTAHVHPDGWGNGGLTEKEQADILVRMTKNIRDAGCAGGIIFEWQDEWWKRVSDYFTRPFSKYIERKPLWLNYYDPEEFFGILGYRSILPIPLLRGDAKDWGKAVVLIESKEQKPKHGAIKKLYAFSDAAFIYLRLDIEKAKGAEKTINWANSQYWIAINTLPGKAGTRIIPDVGLVIEKGANFLIKLSYPDECNIYISGNYNPNMWIYKDAIPGGKRLWRRNNMSISLENSSPFEEIIIEANQPRYGRDGSVFPPKFVSRSALKYGTSDPAAYNYNSHSAWHFDNQKGIIEMRIPWGLLYFMDPSSHLVFGGTDKNGEPFSEKTEGITIAVLHLKFMREQDRKPIKLLDSLPTAEENKINPQILYKWEEWDEVRYESFLKPSYYSLQEVFKNIDRNYKF